MKKHDEGYVLAYVTVVLLVFCLVATVILTGALQNLQAQQNSIDQMKDKYAAQGMIEQALAQMQAGKTVKNNEWRADDYRKLLLSKDENDATLLTIVAQCNTVTVTCTYDTSDSYKCIDYSTGTAEIPAELGGGT